MLKVVLCFIPCIYSIPVLNGFGHDVDWWIILKLPQEMMLLNGTLTTSHCTCTQEKYPSRGSGLCYLYADSNMPSLESFSSLGYDCLGQGGFDPLSQTILAHRKEINTTHWAYFNDQFNGRSITHLNHTCTGESNFNAHSKGLVAYDDKHGGFYLQSSTPNYPEPNANSEFPQLGTQRDNNVFFAQHFAAFSFSTDSMEEVGSLLKTVRQCSTNYYHDDEFISPSFRNANKSMKETSSIYQALVDPHLSHDLPPIPHKRNITTKQGQVVHLIVKTAVETEPPWSVVGNYMQMDVSVATWWDPSYGLPTICANDNYAISSSTFCLPLSNGTVSFNVENIIQLHWHEYSWWALGGLRPGGNHGKWGLSTPRNGHHNQTVVFFGDLNQEGFPCSHTCSGAQGGRGGVFWSLDNPALWDSIRQLKPTVCSCTSDKVGFLEHRMCQHGCIKRLEREPVVWPVLTGRASSFWDQHTFNIEIKR